MTALDDKLVPKILSLIDKFGKTAVFTELTTNTYDPATGTVSTVEVNHNRKMSPPSDYDLRYVDNDLIKMGDAQTMVAASGIPFTPVQAMKVAFDSNDWHIVTVSPVYTGNIIGAYKLQLRR